MAKQMRASKLPRSIYLKDSHLINISQVVENSTSTESSWRQYYSLERGDEQSSNAMLYTYTGAFL